MEQIEKNSRHGGYMRVAGTGSEKPVPIRPIDIPTYYLFIHFALDSLLYLTSS